MIREHVGFSKTFSNTIGDITAISWDDKNARQFRWVLPSATDSHDLTLATTGCTCKTNTTPLLSGRTTVAAGFGTQRSLY